MRRKHDVQELSEEFNDETELTEMQSGNGESIWKVGCEICLPFVLAGLGMVLAGALLDSVQHWPVFDSCPQLFILVPALLGLKVSIAIRCTVV